MSPKFLDKFFFGKNGGETRGKAQLGSVLGLFSHLAMLRAYIGSHLGCKGSLGANLSSVPLWHWFWEYLVEIGTLWDHFSLNGAHLRPKGQKFEFSSRIQILDLKSVFYHADGNSRHFLTVRSTVKWRLYVINEITHFYFPEVTVHLMTPEIKDWRHFKMVFFGGPLGFQRSSSAKWLPKNKSGWFHW